jgi:hypothetical protein
MGSGDIGDVERDELKIGSERHEQLYPVFAVCASCGPGSDRKQSSEKAKLYNVTNYSQAVCNFLRVSSIFALALGQERPKIEVDDAASAAFAGKPNVRYSPQFYGG